MYNQNLQVDINHVIKNYYKRPDKKEDTSNHKNNNGKLSRKQYNVNEYIRSKSCLIFEQKIAERKGNPEV